MDWQALFDSKYRAHANILYGDCIETMEWLGSSIDWSQAINIAMCTQTEQRHYSAETALRQTDMNDQMSNSRQLRTRVTEQHQTPPSRSLAAWLSAPGLQKCDVETRRQHERFPVSAAAAPPVLDRAGGLLHEGCLVQPYSSQDAGVLCHAERRDDADERQDDLRLLSGLFRERRVRRLQPQGTTASLPTVRVAVHQSLAHFRLHLLRGKTCCSSISCGSEICRKGVTELGLDSRLWGMCPQ